MADILTVAGTMSGTSLDGVDVAILATDGASHLVPGTTGFHPYSDDERSILRQAYVAGAAMKQRTDRDGVIADAESIVTQAHILALKDGISRFSGHVDYVGFHGQTIFHDPQRKLTVQIGNAQEIAKALGIPVVHDFRANDVAQGGEGAPLAPIFHASIIQKLEAKMPALFLNIGGVANVTYMAESGDLLAFDTGPGNALMDDYMMEHFGTRMDEDGRIAAKGNVDSKALDILIAHPFFYKKPPKSLDRQEFHGFARKEIEDLAPQDAIATLNAFTVLSLQKALQWCLEPPRSVIVSGGGAKNPVIMAGLKRVFEATPQTASSLGWDDDFIEANAFAYLAVRSLKKLPISFPGTTCIAAPLTGGEVAYP